MNRTLVSLLSLLWLQVAALAVEQPGPSASLLASPIYSAGVGLVYICSQSYYVDGSIGNDANPGSMAQPWKTIQHADTLPRSPGDCINVVPGTYTWTGTFTLSHGGNVASPTGYVTYRCEVLDQCFVVYLGPPAVPVWAIPVPYLIFDGFDTDGGGLDVGGVYGGLSNGCFDSSLADTGTPGHHIWVLNNRVHDCNGSCIGMNDSEYYFALHNEVFNCSWTNQFETSGLGFVVLKPLGGDLNPYPAYTPTTADLAFAPFHNMASWNFVHDNGCTTCIGATAALTTSANTHSNDTLDGFGSVGVTASFMANVENDTITLNVTSVQSGTLAPGQVVFGSGLSAGINIAVQTGGTTGGIGTYILRAGVDPFASAEPMTSSTIGPLQLVTGPGIQPMTYVQSFDGTTVTMTRPALTTQSGGTFVFQGLQFGHTDGNGIIMDTFCGAAPPCFGTGAAYPNQTLVSFNDIQFNGARGLHLFRTGPGSVTAINNSAYHNGIDITSQGGGWGEFSNIGSQNSNWANNVGFAVNNAAAALGNCLFGNCNYALVAGDASSEQIDINVTYFNNVLFGAGGVAVSNNDSMYYVPANNRQLDPLYTNDTSQTIGDLHLLPDSPAIEYAIPHAYPYIPRGTTDSGAYQTGGLRTANFIEGAPPFTGELGVLKLPIIPTPLTCSEATTFLARVSGMDRVHIDGYQNLICGMVLDGTWCGSTLDVFYVFATANAAAAQLNLCSTNFSATLHGSPAFTPNLGYTGVDSSSTVYIDTGFNPSTAGGNYSSNSAHVGVWNTTIVTSSDTGGSVIGATGGGFAGLTNIFPSFDAVTKNFYSNINNTGFNFTQGPANPNTLGQHLVNRSSSTDVQQYKNGTQIVAYTQAELDILTNIFILAQDNGGVAELGSGLTVGAATIGASLTATQVEQICHRLNIWMNAIGATPTDFC